MKMQKMIPLLTLAFAALIKCGMGDSKSLDQKLGWGYSEPPLKPGECPASNPGMYCYEQKDLCKSDCECPNRQKCCYQANCGLSCKDPVGEQVKSVRSCEDPIGGFMKPGKCQSLFIQCFQCYDQCKSDCECPGKQKCCLQSGCGNMCTDAA